MGFTYQYDIRYTMAMKLSLKYEGGLSQIAIQRQF